jgi:glycosyltransferase involved in cell wall biosynthesis
VVIWGPSEFEPVFTDPPSTGGIVVGYIGNAVWWQGLHTLVGAAKILEDVPEISFALAGFDASNEMDFPRLPRVSYVGRVERKDIPRFLRSCDVLVSSRLNEGVANLQYPQKLSEYLGAGRPVIVSAANDQPAIVKKAKCGIVVDPMTEGSLASAIQTFAHMSRQTQLEWGMHALDFAKEHLVFDAFAKKIHALYLR